MEQENNPNLMKSTMTSGAILGVALVIFSLILYMTGLIFSKGLNYISWLILVGGIVLGMKSYRDQQQGFISYGRALGVGMLTVLFASIIAALFNYILYAFIDPSLIEKSIEMARNQMVEKGTLSDEQIEMGLNMTKKIMQPGIMSLMTILGSGFMGLIFSLIIAAFMKNEKSVFHSDALDNNQQ